LEKKPEVKAAPAKVAAKPAAKAAPKAAVKKAAPKAAAKPAAKAAPKAAAKPAAKAAPKAAAAKKDVAPSVELQFNSGYNVKLDDVVASVKAACGKATGIKTFNIYVNQGEGKAFYVINGDITGSVDL
jgi:septal ring-binding cell division protein DamX